jgi:phage shock protein PspC (stress-responsive transcriptional regulator)
MTDERPDRTPEESAEPTQEESPEAGDTVIEEAPVGAPTQPRTEIPAPTTAAAERRLVRRPEGKMIAGVCTGLAAYLGVDVVAIRIAAVLLAVFTGVGLVAYLVMWIVMPMAPEGEPIVAAAPRNDTNMGRWIGVGAVVLGAFILFRNFWDFRGGFFWGLLLIGIGVAVWGREFVSPRNGAPRPLAPPNPPPAGGGAPTEPSSSFALTPQTPAPPAPPPPPPIARRAASPAPAPSPSRREPSVLGRLVVGAAALAVGIAVLLHNVGAFNVSAKGILAVLLAIVALGLIVGAWLGRARWLIFPGIVLTIGLGITAIMPVAFLGGSYGEVLWQPTSRSDLRPRYTHAAGEAVLDLSQVRWGSKDKNVYVHLGFGELLVVVPRDIPVKVKGRVQGGEADLFGLVRSGWGVEHSATEPGDPDLGTLNLDIRMNFGEMRVRDVRPNDEFRASDYQRGAKVGVNFFRGVPGVSVDTHNGDKR